MSITVLLIKGERKAESKNRNIPRHNLAALERLPEIHFDLLMSNFSTELLLHGNLPSQDFLIGESNYYYFSNPVENPQTQNPLTHEEVRLERRAQQSTRGTDQTESS